MHPRTPLVTKLSSFLSDRDRVMHPPPCRAHFRARRDTRWTIRYHHSGVLTYHPSNVQVKNIITRNLHLVRDDPETAGATGPDSYATPWFMRVCKTRIYSTFVSSALVTNLYAKHCSQSSIFVYLRRATTEFTKSRYLSLVWWSKFGEYKLPKGAINQLFGDEPQISN